MAPSTHLEAPPESPAKKAQPAETKVLESRKPNSAATSVKVHRLPEEGSFQSSMLEFNHMDSSKKWLNTLISLTLNCTVVIIPIFMGLYFTDTLDMRQFASTFLVAPPPPPPPPPPAAPVEVVRVKPMARLMESGKLVAPRVIPKEVKIIKEEAAAPDFPGGVAGGVPGGVAGGSMGGVIGGVIGGVATISPLAPKREGPKAPVRVGGRVKEPRLLQRIDPVYPALAKQTHLQGSVIIDAIIDEHGNIIEMKVVSGPPLLLQSALDAVKRWKYEPTYLNDEPVPVQLNVTVTFRLND